MFNETTKPNGHIVRTYKNETIITYTKDKDINVILVSSAKPGKGNARFAFTNFVATNKQHTINVRISDELGTDIPQLIRFYKKHGFKLLKRETNHVVWYQRKAG